VTQTRTVTRTRQLQDRRRRSCVSPVLTAIGLVNGNPSYLTPTELTSLNRSPKNLAHVIMSTTSTAVQNLVEICLWGASREVGEIQPFFYLYPFLATHLQVRPFTTFLRLMAHMTRTAARM